MAMVGVVSGSLHVQADSQPKSSGLVLGRRPLGAILHSSNEPGELSQWLCHDDSTINIVVLIIIIVILGVQLSSDLSLDKHVNVVSAKCFFQLRQPRHIRRSLDDDSVATLVHAFVASRVDYCGSLLIGAPRKTTDKLQRVLNSAARIVSNTRKTLLVRKFDCRTARRFCMFSHCRIEPVRL